MDKRILKFHKLLLLFFLLVQSCNSQKKATPEQEQILETAKTNFVFVEGGTFTMGKNGVSIAREHQVTLDSYSISKYETTWEEFDLYFLLNEKEIINPQYRKNIEDYGPKYAAKKNTWFLAKAYCQWLGEQLNLPIDLPTEAQWEYAARSRGLDVEHATNSGKIEGGINDNYGVDNKVGIYPPNPLGLYDMSGGRPEWTNDWLALYSKEPVVNPRFDSIVSGTVKVIRGFHKLSNSVYIRSSREPEQDGFGGGFRCVCNQKTPIK
ncbi:formylglycine-generating enzyme family protein [Cellulophaga baltica]|uniref:formylglycine-generating enzyme family protein n=1 Tax=Cellulophaga TaxID=104264 RepID=UPI001C072CE5|nr:MULTISPECIES: SUMF1/EgtB/PvdO family nonheme iron enzyme [Cellulophaga]MBU2995595.1 formylglycine-generating enzyme family protein [Cellulophaga baltica]MDO6766989.1 SUMF1/EgtB/PvdO family nonheme iron enzyme [Cellulophaga sp. 1_MG-2023]